MSEVFRFGAERVGGKPIKKGLLYQDERDKVAQVQSCFDGYVNLLWQASGRETLCSEERFRKRFSLYGNGH